MSCNCFRCIIFCMQICAYKSGWFFWTQSGLHVISWWQIGMNNLHATVVCFECNNLYYQAIIFVQSSIFAIKILIIICFMVAYLIISCVLHVTTLISMTKLFIITLSTLRNSISKSKLSFKFYIANWRKFTNMNIVFLRNVTNAGNIQKEKNYCLNINSINNIYNLQIQHQSFQVILKRFNHY